jgi:endonuclease III
VLLITHGREICHARNPKHDICPVADRCRFFLPKAP